MSMGRTRGKVPVRMCVACRKRRQKHELFRVYLTADGSPRLGEGEGRGAYLCKDLSCVERAAAKGKLGASLRAGLSREATDQVFLQVRSELHV